MKNIQLFLGSYSSCLCSFIFTGPARICDVTMSHTWIYSWCKIKVVSLTLIFHLFLLVSVVSVVSFRPFRSYRSFRLFRWFRFRRFARFGCFGRFGGFVSLVSLVSVVSFRPFRFVVSGFSTCLNKAVREIKIKTDQQIPD